ncbi:hypothetical protein ACF98C_004130 [Enterobacter hormaechei]
MLTGQSGDTAFLFKGQPDQFHFKFRRIAFPGKSFFGAHEVSTCKISGCLSYRILDSGPDGTQTTLTDEPTTGLHASDADRLLVQLQRLVDAENTVIMIEHDMRAVTQADQVIDIGPGAGHEGGRLVAAGTPEQVSQVKESRTAQYIARELSRNG